MSKFILAFFFIVASILSAQANTCSINLKLGGGLYPESLELSVQNKMEKALAQKGYVASSSEDAEYSLRVHYGHALTTTDCYVFAAAVEIMNSGKQVVADGSSEASFFREMFAKNSIPKAMTLKAFKKAMKSLPICE
jgi:hypothetical protein